MIADIDRHNIDKLLLNYKDVFKNELGTLKGVKGKLHLKPNTVPVFCRARSVPFSQREKVNNEIDRMVNKGMMFPVSYSEWATPVVPVPKKDGTLRLCGDYKTTLNKFLHCENYPLPKIDDIFAELSRGKFFSHLDLKNAYTQMLMDEDSQKLLTINTPKGLFRLRRLIYGVASASGLWQKSMEQVLQGLDGVKVILDDMLVFGATKEEHLRNLENVLKRLSEAGLVLNKKKCRFLENRIEYCGHVIDATGLHKSPKKIQAMVECPAPTNVTQVRAFLGLVNYYHKFLPNLATELHPLHELLKKGKNWVWTNACQKAFDKVKKMLVSDQVLTYYDPELPICLACDASSYGVGAVLSHVYPDGTERPISFASRSLSKSEKGYAQIDKEALSIIFGIKKFYNYIFGRHFTLVTDHKPLTHIFNPEKGIPMMSAARLQRYALILAAHRYDIEYKKTDLHANADGMSRLPLPIAESEMKVHRVDYADVYYGEQLNNLPVTPQMISSETRKDPILGRVFAAIQSGKWPHDKETQPYYTKRNELSVCQGCIVWGPRVIVPKRHQKSVLRLLHEGHLGIVKMKAVARSNVWWQGIDKDIEKLAGSCEGCLQTSNRPQQATIHPWTRPDGPWQRLHIDFATRENIMFLIVVCAYSKWPEVIMMRTDTKTGTTVKALDGLFSRYGLPLEIVSDNGPQFISKEFEDFLSERGIKHSPVPAYHPQSNGQAERFVQTFKNSLKKMRFDKKVLTTKIHEGLLAYRNAPHALTNETPANLFLKRALRTKLSQIQPSTEDVVRHKNLCIALRRGRSEPNFALGEEVLALNFRGDKTWLHGVIVERKGPRTFLINISPKANAPQIVKRHLDQIKKSCSLGSTLPSGQDDYDGTFENFKGSINTEQASHNEWDSAGQGEAQMAQTSQVPLERENRPESPIEANGEEVLTALGSPMTARGREGSMSIPPSQNSPGGTGGNGAVDTSLERRNPGRHRRPPDRLNL